MHIQKFLQSQKYLQAKGNHKKMLTTIMVNSFQNDVTSKMFMVSRVGPWVFTKLVFNGVLLQ